MVNHYYYYIFFFIFNVLCLEYTSILANNIRGGNWLSLHILRTSDSVLTWTKYTFIVGNTKYAFSDLGMSRTWKDNSEFSSQAFQPPSHCITRGRYTLKKLLQTKQIDEQKLLSAQDVTGSTTSWLVGVLEMS